MEAGAQHGDSLPRQGQQVRFAAHRLGEGHERLLRADMLKSLLNPHLNLTFQVGIESTQCQLRLFPGGDVA